MKNRTMFLSVAGPLALACTLLVASPAWAHHPYIDGTAVCTDSGDLVINWTAGVNSTTQYECENPEVYIYLNGAEVASGAFIYPGCTMSGTLPGVGDASSPASIGVLAAGTWLDGATGGQSAYSDVTYPDEPCSQPGFGRFTGGGHQIRVDGVRVTVQLLANRSPDQVGAVRIKSLLYQQIDLAQVHHAQIDGDLFRLGHAGCPFPSRWMS